MKIITLALAFLIVCGSAPAIATCVVSDSFACYYQKPQKPPTPKKAKKPPKPKEPKKPPKKVKPPPKPPWHK
jgi:hypothetical protein